MQRVQLSRTRSAIAYATLAALVALMSLTQCTPVGNSITGVTLDHRVATTCVRQCNDLYTALVHLEERKHVTEHGICHTIDDPQLARDCLQGESARHTAVIDQLRHARVDCLNSCARP